MTETAQVPDGKPAWELQVFYDGDCPLCCREMNWLRKRTGEVRVAYRDICAADFRPAQYGLTHSEFMAQIRAQLPDGSLITGVEVFRRLYAAAGFGWLLGWTSLPGFRQLADWGYRVFARNRLRLTGRCESGICEVDRPSPSAKD